MIVGDVAAIGEWINDPQRYINSNVSMSAVFNLDVSVSGVKLATLSYFLTSHESIEIVDFNVSPAFHNAQSGIEKPLVSSIIKWFSRHGIESIYIDSTNIDDLVFKSLNLRLCGFRWFYKGPRSRQYF